MTKDEKNKNTHPHKDSHEHHCENCTCEDNHKNEHHHQSEPEHETVTLTLEDNTQLICPIIDLFEIADQEYIALLHPTEETALLYQIFQHEDEEIEINTIEDHEEYELASKTFLSLQAQYELEETFLEEDDDEEDDDEFGFNYDEDEDNPDEQELI